MHHFDMGHRGSEFTVLHQPVKNLRLVITLLVILLTVAFSVHLHFLDKKNLTKVCLVLAVCLLLKLSSKIYSESVIILPSLGLQVETQYYLGHVSTHFICLSQIQDIIITEAVTLNCVLTYLVVLLNQEAPVGQQSLYPLFTHSWPPIAELKHVYLVARHKLFSSKAT